MKLQFNLEYQTTFGEELVLNMIHGEGKTPQTKVEQHKMTTLDGFHWFCEISRSIKTSSYVDTIIASGAAIRRHATNGS